MIATEIQQHLNRKYPPAGTFEFINGVWLHYWQHLPEHYDAAVHKTIVMVHGLSGSLNDYLYSHTLMNNLKPDYRIILIDRPGAGYSYITNDDTYTLEDQIEIIKELLKRLAVTNPVIVGHSLGGCLALHFAALNPTYEAKYVLLAPLVYPVWLMYFPLLFLLKIKWLRLLFFRLLLWFQNLFFHQLIRNAFRPNANLLQKDYEAITKDLLSSWPVLKSEFTNLMSVKDSIVRNRHLYKTIQQPVTILAGKNDMIVPTSQHAERLIVENPRIQLKVFSRTGHMINFAQPLAIAEAIRNISS